LPLPVSRHADHCAVGLGLTVDLPESLVGSQGGHIEQNAFVLCILEVDQLVGELVHDVGYIGGQTVAGDQVVLVAQVGLAGQTD